MHIAVFGTGGVGGYCSGRLAQAGKDVTFIARGAHWQALQKTQGLRVDSVMGDFVLHPMQAAPGHMRHAGGEPFVKFGELDNRASIRLD